MKNPPVSFRPSDKAVKIMEIAMDRLGVSRSAVLEMAVRAFAEKCGIEVGDDDEHDDHTKRNNERLGRE